MEHQSGSDSYDGEMETISVDESHSDASMPEAEIRLKFRYPCADRNIPLYTRKR
jgi:hypothetical protein